MHIKSGNGTILSEDLVLDKGGRKLTNNWKVFMFHVQWGCSAKNTSDLNLRYKPPHESPHVEKYFLQQIDI